MPWRSTPTDHFQPCLARGAGAFAAVGRFVQASVDGHLAQIETTDAVERSAGLGAQLIEHARSDPVVATGPQRGVGHAVLEDRFDVDPR